MADGLAALTWTNIDAATAGPPWALVVIVAIMAVFAREMWRAHRETVPVSVSAVTGLLAVAALIIVSARLLALAR